MANTAIRTTLRENGISVAELTQELNREFSLCHITSIELSPERKAKVLAAIDRILARTPEERAEKMRERTAKDKAKENAVTEWQVKKAVSLIKQFGGEVSTEERKKMREMNERQLQVFKSKKIYKILDNYKGYII